MLRHIKKSLAFIACVISFSALGILELPHASAKCHCICTGPDGATEKDFGTSHSLTEFGCGFRCINISAWLFCHPVNEASSENKRTAGGESQCNAGKPCNIERLLKLGQPLPNDPK